MKNKLTLPILVTVFMLAFAWSGHSQTEKPRSVGYQYDVIYDPTEGMGQDEGLKKLNELGAQGWEIVGVSQADKSHPRLYLRRTLR